MIFVIKLDIGYTENSNECETQEYYIDFPFIPRMWFLPDRILVSIDVSKGTYALIIDSPKKEGVKQSVHMEQGITKVLIWDEMFVDIPEYYEDRLVFPHSDFPFCHENGGMLIPGIDTTQGMYLQVDPEASRNYSTDIMTYCGIESVIPSSLQPQVIEDRNHDMSTQGDDWSQFAPDFEGDDILLCDTDRNYKVSDAVVFRDLEQDRQDFPDLEQAQKYFEEAYFYGNKSLIPKNPMESPPPSPPPTPEDSLSWMSTEDMSPRRMDVDT